MVSEAIDKKYLAGLVFKAAKPKKTEEGTVNVATERALKPEDVLDWVDNGETITLVTADGKKYTVSKKAAKE